MGGTQKTKVLVIRAGPNCRFRLPISAGSGNIFHEPPFLLLVVDGRGCFSAVDAHYLPMFHPDGS